MWGYPALQLFASRFGDDVLQTLVPKILEAATADPSVEDLPIPPKAKAPKVPKLREVAEADGDKLGGGDVQSDPPATSKEVTLSAVAAYSLLANLFLLNVQDFQQDLQKLYLSSAKAAPQKILCLLTFFHFSDGSPGPSPPRTLHFQRATLLPAPELRRTLPEPVAPVVPVAQGSEGSGTAEGSLETKPDGSATEAAPDAKLDVAGDEPAPEEEMAEMDMDSSAEGEHLECPSFFPCFAKAAGGESESAMLVLLSSASSFCTLEEVKTPPEEVPLWEFPELICVRLLLGSVPLTEEEVLLVRRVQHVNRCSTEGPLLTLSEERPPEMALYNMVAMDISRHVDDRRFAIEVLRRDATKWSAAFRLIGESWTGPVAVAHAPLLGVDKHWCYAMQVLTAGHHGQKLRYALSLEGYGSASRDEQLSAAQAREAKHFEALTARMVSTAWRPCDLLRLLALFPFLRNASEKFHAFWTRRLRDKSLPDFGRPTREELAKVRRRQEELWPPPPKVESPVPEPKVEAATASAAKPLEPEKTSSWRYDWKSKQRNNHYNEGWSGHWKHWNWRDQKDDRNDRKDDRKEERYHRDKRDAWKEDRYVRRESRSPERKKSRKEEKDVKKVDRRKSARSPGSPRSRRRSRSRSRQRKKRSRERRR
eukprot:s2000_g2.t1